MAKKKKEKRAPHALEVIKGIGPKFSERLQKAGLSSIEALAKADVGELTAKLGKLPPRTVASWIVQAKALQPTQQRFFTTGRGVTPIVIIPSPGWNPLNEPGSLARLLPPLGGTSGNALAFAPMPNWIGWVD